MVLKYCCGKCKKIFPYDGHNIGCCNDECEEIYLCDTCGIFLTEDTLFIHEEGIVCYELCRTCMESPRKKIRYT